jgi:cell wall-associated protease
VTGTGLTVTGVTPDKASPQVAGNPITFTATTTGGVAPLQYKWYVYNAKTWSIGQVWSTNNTFAWTPSTPGSYQLQVWARNSGTTTDTAEAHKTLAYTVTPPPPLSVTSLTANQASPQPIGTPITFTTTATGGVAPYQYKWYVYNGKTWSIGQVWGTGNTFTWTPTAPGPTPSRSGPGTAGPRPTRRRRTGRSRLPTP